MVKEIKIDGETYVCKRKETEPETEYYEIPIGARLNEEGYPFLRDGKRVLHYEEVDSEGWCVSHSRFPHESFSDYYILVPCEREDLKPGDVAYFTNKSITEDIKSGLLELQSSYVVILRHGKNVRPWHDAVREYYTDCNSWFKVVPRKEWMESR